MRQASFLRLIACVIALGLPLFGFAADKIIISSVAGKARQKIGENSQLLASGNELSSDGYVQVASASTLGLTLPDGTKVNFGPGSVFRIKNDGGAIGITLLSGSVSGDFTSPAPLIRTTVGSVTPTDSSAQITVSPGRPGKPAKLGVSSLSGTPVVMLSGSTTAVGITAGQRMDFGGSLTEPARVQLTPAEIQSVKNAIAGVLEQAGQSSDPRFGGRSNSFPNLSQLGIPRDVSPAGQ